MPNQVARLLDKSSIYVWPVIFKAGTGVDGYVHLGGQIPKSQNLVKNWWNWILLRIVNSTNGGNNCITYFDLDVLLLIIITRSWLSIFNKILWFWNLTPQMNADNPVEFLGSNFKREIEYLLYNSVAPSKMHQCYLQNCATYF
jgi:hypothetical protein